MRSDNRVEGIRAAFMLVLVCGTLASCASKPEPDRAAVLKDALPSVVVPGAWTSAAEKGTVPDGWLRSFNDAGLEAVVGEAMKNNLDLRAAQSKLDVAAGAAGAAGPPSSRSSAHRAQARPPAGQAMRA